MDRTEVVVAPRTRDRRIPGRVWIPLACAAAVVMVLLVGTAIDPARRQHVSAGAPGGGTVPVSIPDSTTTSATAVPTTIEPVVPPSQASTTSTLPEATGATLTLACQPAHPGSVTCSWSRSDLPTFASYVLLRSTPGARGRVVTQTNVRTVTTASDAGVPTGTVTYVLDVLDSVGRTVAHSNPVTVTCC